MNRKKVRHCVDGVVYEFCDERELTTVLEYNVGEESDLEDLQRSFVLLDTDMDSSLRVQDKLIAGDIETLRTLALLDLLRTTCTRGHQPSPMLALGWNFKSDRPKIEITF